jgi:hypothetical protein
MLDDDFNKRRANLVRDLASRADPFTKRRLLDLALRYETRSAKTSPPPASMTGEDHSDQNSDGKSGSRSHQHSD